LLRVEGQIGSISNNRLHSIPTQDVHPERGGVKPATSPDD
jgi:hypothetical protein